MVSIAVLGCGRIGRMHAANIAAHPRATLAGAYDVHAPSATSVAESLGARVFASAEAVFAAGGVDAVLIATSTPTHVDLIEQGVRAGKAILCEKPIDLSLERVNALRARIGRESPVLRCRSCWASCAASMLAIPPRGPRCAPARSASFGRSSSPRATQAWHLRPISRSRAASSAT
jgi:hypothetical protein